MSEAGTHILRISLQGESWVYREIEIESRKTLSDLAEAIVDAFGFKLGNSFGFYSKLTGPDVMRSPPNFVSSADLSDESDTKSVGKTHVADAFSNVGHSMLLMLDYADNWRFVVEVIGLGQKAAKTRYPKVLKKVGDAPEQHLSWDNEDVLGRR
jgi:Plasmid pRiA4b ORF-3-like protein